MDLAAITGTGTEAGPSCALYELIVEQLPRADAGEAGRAAGRLWREIDRLRRVGGQSDTIAALEALSVELHGLRQGAAASAARINMLAGEWRSAAALGV